LLLRDEEGFPLGSGSAAKPRKIEKPGSFFHPLLATLITGAARLMLAIAERLTLSAGLDWAFCDTDSMAIAKPDGMDHEAFVEECRNVASWFDLLNPYEAKDPDAIWTRATGYSPLRIWISVPQLVVVVTRMSASSGPISGIGFSSSAIRPILRPTASPLIMRRRDRQNRTDKGPSSLF
jgi:hypothetical protein